MLLEHLLPSNCFLLRRIQRPGEDHEENISDFRRYRIGRDGRFRPEHSRYDDW
jgi:hypothetical protein